MQQRRGLSYLLVSHDLGIVAALCHDMIVMRAGQVVEAGPTRRVLSSPRTEHARALIAAAGLEPTDASLDVVALK